MQSLSMYRGTYWADWILHQQRRWQLERGPSWFVECLWITTDKLVTSLCQSDYLHSQRIYFQEIVTHQGLPCTPQSQTSPLPPPPRTEEQPGQSAAPQTFSASQGAPDLWTWEDLSALPPLHWKRWLQRGGEKTLTSHWEGINSCFGLTVCRPVQEFVNAFLIKTQNVVPK